MKAQRIVRVLNNLIAKDEKALANLMQYRVTCSDDLANTPGVKTKMVNGQGYFGLLGLINTILEDKTELVGFNYTRGKFCVVANEEDKVRT